MNRIPPPRPFALVPLAVAVLLTACGRARPTPRHEPYTAPPALAPYQSEVAEGIGAAVVILIDTSGSMKESAPGDARPKHVVAREAVARMLAATEGLRARRPDFAIKIAIAHFSSSARIVLPIGPYDLAAAEAALARIPLPGGGTAIGDAMRTVRPELYRGGVFRKYMIVVTDGENTAGSDPGRVAREIHLRSEGAVTPYFVAFDTDPHKFSFLGEVGGEVLPAQNAAGLEKALTEIYEGRILAEAVDYGEPAPTDPNTGR